jgi:delta-1-pyrroline-5-carboxylate synthetase
MVLVLIQVPTAGCLIFQYAYPQTALRDNDVKYYGGEKAASILGITKAVSSKHEYGEKALTLELVSSMDEAIDHIHQHGSSHTECIVTGDSL